MIVIELLHNLFGLVALSVLSGFVSTRIEKQKTSGKIIQGLLFGFIAFLGMQYPYIIHAGLIFDGRSIVLSLCTLFFGPLAGLISSGIALIYRIYVGGIGIYMGSAVILCSFLIGYLFYYLRERMVYRITLLNLYLFGLLVHIAMLLCMLLLPQAVRLETLEIVTFTVIGIYPLTTLLIGSLLIDQEQKLSAFKLLKNSESALRATIYSIGDAVITTDIYGSVLQMNKVAEQLTGWTEEEALGRKLEDVYQIQQEQSGERLDTPVIRMLKNKDEVGSITNVVLKSKNDNLIPISESGNKITDIQGDIMGAVLVFRDQTQERIKMMELEESYQLFFRTFHLSPVPMILVAADDGTIQDVNEMFLEETGYNQDDLMNFSLDQLNLFLSDDDQRAIFRAIKGKGKLYAFPFQLQIKDGTKRDYLISSNKIFLNQREFYLSSILDITDKKRNELVSRIQLNLANSMITANSLYEFLGCVKNELEAVIDTRNLIFALYDEKTDMLSAPFSNDEKETILPSWPAKTSLTGYVVRQSKTVLLNRDEISDLFAKGEIEILGERAEHWLGIPLKIGQKVLGVIVIQSYKKEGSFNKQSIEIIETAARQLTIYIDKKRVEDEALKLSKAVVQSPVSIVITDTNGLIEYVNPKFTDLTGYTLDEALGKNPMILKSGEHSASYYKEMWDKILNGNEWHGEFHNIKKNGEHFWESAFIAPIIGAGGEITHFVAVKEDITEKKRMQDELIREKDRAELSDRLKTAFLQNMSHEIRTPLNSILGFANLLERDSISPGNVSQYANVITTSGKRLMELINNIIDISKIETGSLEVNEKEFKISKLIYEVSEQFKPLSSSNNIPIYTLIDPSCIDRIIISDELRIHQLLTNLINNAFKFTSEGRIEVGCALKESELLFHVKDTGSGISEENQGKIFERFFQIDSSMTRGYEGSGLGLSICKGLVDLLKGKIWVDSELEKGSTFYFTIPLKEGNKNVVATLQNTKELGIKYKNILIAEDDDFSFFYLREILSNFPVQIIRVNDGIEAVETCSRMPEIELVLMDIKMPRMNGIDATREIKKNNPMIKVIAQTAYAYQNEKQAAFEVGCDNYLSKPITVEKLLESLSN